MRINYDKSVTIPKIVLEKLKITEFTQENMNLLRYESKVDIAIEHFFNKIPIKNLAIKYDFTEDEIKFFTNAYEDFVIKYTQNKRIIFRLNKIEQKYSIELKLKVLILCIENKISLREISDKFGIHISSIYKWINIVKKTDSVVKIYKDHTNSSAVEKNTLDQTTRLEEEVKNKVIKIDLEKRNSIVKEYLEGCLTMKEIAEKYKVLTYNIYNWKNKYIKELNKSKNTLRISNKLDEVISSGNKFPKKQENIINDIYVWKEHYSKIKSSELEGFSNNELIVENTNKGVRKFEDKFKISVVKEYLEGGVTLNNLAKKHNINQINIYNWKKKYGNKIEEKMSISKEGKIINTEDVNKLTELESEVKRLKKIIDFLISK